MNSTVKMLENYLNGLKKHNNYLYKEQVIIETSLLDCKTKIELNNKEISEFESAIATLKRL